MPPLRQWALLTVSHLMVPLDVGHHALHVHLTSEQGPITGVESEVPHDVLDSWHSACSH